MTKKVFWGLLLLTLATSPLPASEPGRDGPLSLPPQLEQILPIHEEASYFGDALRPVDCPDDEDNPLGTCGNLLFGARALTGTPLSGFIRIQFSPPKEGVTHFRVTHPGGLEGEESILSAPQFFRFPLKDHRFQDPPDGLISEGDLNLETGEVTHLSYRIEYSNSGLEAIGRVNPDLQRPTIEFPGEYGSAWAEFSQREDGLLDFTFSGSTFFPVGNDLEGAFPRFPLPFCSLEGECASVRAPGTSLNPHLFVTTRVEEPALPPEGGLELPENTVWIMDTHARNTSFGDAFRLNIPQLGGSATGRSHLMGRLQIQFGERFGPNLPFTVSSLPPAGLLAEPPDTPLAIPGVSVGLLGHNEFLEFPDQTYFLEEVAFLDDPFDIPLGVIDLRNGQVRGEFLYRGFIAQNLIFVLLEQNEGAIEPSSFFFRGPARFEIGNRGQTFFRFDGDVTLPFDGRRFPKPDLEDSWVAGQDSFLDPFLRIRGVQPPPPSTFIIRGEDQTVASTGEVFTYSYSIPCDPTGLTASFEYRNFDPMKGGTFVMDTLASVSCSVSRGSDLPEGEFDTVSFSGFGSWSEDDELHLATVQFSQSEEAPYVSILLDGGFLSNVNTPPENMEDSLP